MKKKCLLFFFSFFLFFFSSSKLQIDRAIYVSAARFQDLIIAQSLARSAREHLREFDNNRDTLARFFSSRRRRRRGERERERGKNLCPRLNTNNPVGLLVRHVALVFFSRHDDTDRARWNKTREKQSPSQM